MSKKYYENASYLLKGDSGNLFIYDERGWIDVNEILGGDYGVEKVTVNLLDGYRVDIKGMKEVTLQSK